MGSETIKLPVIDFSNLKQQNGTSPIWDSLKTQVLKALQEFGCFEAKFDEIPLNLRKSTIDGIKQLFELPLETKLRNRSNKHYHGFMGQYPHLPLYQSMGIEDAASRMKIESFTNLMWPEGNPAFSKSVQSFSEQLYELDKMVRRLVVESLGLGKYMDEHMNSTNYVVRVQKYEKPESNETELGLKLHTDINLVTILYQNEVNGLQVLTKDGKWIAIEPSPDSFVVMIGDSLHAWTNGRLHSPYHKVMMTGNGERYSIGLFSFTKPGYIIKAPHDLVDEDHPLLFKPFDPAEYRKFYYSEAGQASPAALKAYCGV